MYRFPMVSSVGHGSYRRPALQSMDFYRMIQMSRFYVRRTMLSCTTLFQQPRESLGRKPHPLHTRNLGTVDYPQLGSGPLLVAIPSHFSINGIFFRRPSPQDPGKSSGASSQDLGIPCNLGLVDHIARAIQRWNYCQVHEPFHVLIVFRHRILNQSGRTT